MQGTDIELQVVTASGDVFAICVTPGFFFAVTFDGNIGDIPTPTRPMTWGAIKAGYR